MVTIMETRIAQFEKVSKEQFFKDMIDTSLENQKNMEDCNKNSLDFSKVISNHKNNKKYKSMVRNRGFGSTNK